MSDTQIFAAQHKWDRNFFLSLAALAWLGIIMGFGGDMANHLATHETPYPLIVHFHAAAFVGWLVLFTAQILLIRFKKYDTHRKIGLFMACLAVVMIILGPATALTVQHAHMNDPNGDPGFLAIQFTDIIGFTALIVAALLLRKRSSAHKRLILVATLAITDAGFGRWFGEPIMKFLGPSPWGAWAALYMCSSLLILALGAYDLITRRRLHPAYILAALWIFANQWTAVALWHLPQWNALAKQIIAAWP